MRYHGDYEIVIGSDTRQQSLKNALTHITSEYVLVSDIARACIDQILIHTLIKEAANFDVVVPAIGVSDTVVYDGNTIEREKLLRIQTPQISKTSVLRRALQTDTQYSDESSAIVAFGGKRGFVTGDPAAAKITYIHDLQTLPCLRPPSDRTYSGIGFDVHMFDNTKSYIYLCGEKIECGYGFKAHSDGDVAIHALIDAILGAAGMGDIGELFPDTDDAYKGIDSKELLKDVLRKITSYGFEIVNADLTIIAEQPKLLPYKERFRKSLAAVLRLPPAKVNIKATTTEKLGFVGRKEGLAVQAIANIKHFNWMQG